MYLFINSLDGAPINKNDPLLSQLKDQVRSGNYSHQELVVIPESELIRMKVWKY